MQCIVNLNETRTAGFDHVVDDVGCEDCVGVHGAFLKLGGSGFVVALHPCFLALNRTNGQGRRIDLSDR